MSSAAIAWLSLIFLVVVLTFVHLTTQQRTSLDLDPAARKKIENEQRQRAMILSRKKP